MNTIPVDLALALVFLVFGAFLLIEILRGWLDKRGY